MFSRIHEAIQRLAHEVQRVHETDAHERDKLELRLENQNLRAQNQRLRNDLDIAMHEGED